MEGEIDESHEGKKRAGLLRAFRLKILSKVTRPFRVVPWYEITTYQGQLGKACWRLLVRRSQLSNLQHVSPE
jgi:hypothetical protein